MYLLILKCVCTHCLVNSIWWCSCICLLYCYAWSSSPRYCNFFCFSFPPWLARLFSRQGSTVMICIQNVLINLNLNLNFLQIRQQKLEARKGHPLFLLFIVLRMCTHTGQCLELFLWEKGLHNDAENNWSVYTLLLGLSMVVACTSLWDPADIQAS